MKTYLPKISDCLIFARSEGEALEVLAEILGGSVAPDANFIYRALPLDKRGEKLVQGKNRAGYIYPHKTIEDNIKCNKGHFLHYDCDNYKATYIEVETRISILEELISSN